MEFSREVLEKFPGICVAEGNILSLAITDDSPDLDILRLKVADEIKSRYTIENVKDNPTFRAYRDFFWSVGIDPTKTRPASEALVRRLLAGGKLPKINAAVDAYNMASAISGVPIAAFDADRVSNELTMRFARNGESFFGIGMKEPITLKPNQVVIDDNGHIIAVYPYRDSDDTKVTIGTKNMHVIACGVPKIDKDIVLGAYSICAKYLADFSGGASSEPELYP